MSLNKSGIFDSHAHYDDRAFDEDRESLLQALKEAGIDYVVNVGASIASTKAALELAASHDFIYAAVGIHPSETAELTEEFVTYMKQQAINNDKVVAVGEIGLDYYWDEPEPDIQRKWFLRQLDLAKEVKKPIIIHSREAAKETEDILLSAEYKGLEGVIHCYSYSPEMAVNYVNHGFYIGVGGVLTFKNARKLVDTVASIPLDRILLETDCPYMAPVPNRGTRNDSRNLIYVAEKISEIKGISTEEVIKITTENSRRMYGI